MKPETQFRIRARELYGRSISIYADYANPIVLHPLFLTMKQVFEGNSPPGHIKIDSVMKALTTYGSEQLTEEQAHDLVSQLEPDHNGMVNYVEYINMVRAAMNRFCCLGCVFRMRRQRSRCCFHCYGSTKKVHTVVRLAHSSHMGICSLRATDI